MKTTFPGALYGDSDTIEIGTGDAIVMGGAGGDQITTSSSTSFVFGDDGMIDWTGALYPEGQTWAGENSDPTDIDLVMSTDPTDGGDDTISVGAGQAIVVGGAGNDHITGGSGTNVILGDNGEIEGVSGNPDPFGQTLTTAACR